MLRTHSNCGTAADEIETIRRQDWAGPAILLLE